MKKIVLLFMVIFTVAFSGCTKSTSSTSSGVYKGVVLFSICSHTVIQTIGSPNYIGQDTWASGSNPGDPVYHHVFAVQNGCQFGNHPQGDTISFRVIPAQVQNCMYCLIAVAVPDTTIPIQVLN